MENTSAVRISYQCQVLLSVVITFTFFFPLFILCSFDFDLTTNSVLVQTQSAFYLHILFSHLYNNSKKKFNSTMFHSIYICTLIKMHFTKIHLRAHTIFWKHSHKKNQTHCSLLTPV